ncbi:MAG: phenylalanine--tRNA ligase subunit beta [Thermoplasmata archaeon HGW-Thermoplasmata-1]|nr:MAG: phenylalanine--tRNA ligase subunit beta [Thermoplasmata archaeon HGW-Thermoplasmata-1]
MPVISFDYKDFSSLLGRRVPIDELSERLPMIGADLDKVEGSTITIEFFPDRPDLLSVEGVARAMRAFLGFEKGQKKYETAQSGVVLNVDGSVKSVRPFIAAAVVEGVSMTDEMVASIMDLQEKLHVGLGRKRSKVAIGVHNADAVKPPFTYKAVKPDSIRFVPLMKDEEMNLDEILEKHEKGTTYAHLLRGFNRYPLIVDSNGDVLSFPPVINGELTAVTGYTTNFFVDVTGTDQKAVNQALNIVATTLAERGGSIKTVEIAGPDGSKMITPALAPLHMDIDVSYVNSLLGTNMDAAGICDCLAKMEYNTEDAGSGRIRAFFPAWRADILHKIDVVEDIATGYGFENFKGSVPTALTFGKGLESRELSAAARAAMTGLGFSEVMSLTLSNEGDQFGRMGLEDGKRVTLENPITEEHTCIRVSVLPSLLRMLAANKHRELPQSLFEAGEVVGYDEGEPANKMRLAAVRIASRTGFTECKSLVEAAVRDIFGKPLSIVENRHPAFVTGRCAAIMVDGTECGVFGELHPRTITNFELEYPVIAFEMQL